MRPCCCNNCIRCEPFPINKNGCPVNPPFLPIHDTNSRTTCFGIEYSCNLVLNRLHFIKKGREPDARHIFNNSQVLQASCRGEYSCCLVESANHHASVVEALAADTILFYQCNVKPAKSKGDSSCSPCR